MFSEVFDHTGRQAVGLGHFLFCCTYIVILTSQKVNYCSLSIEI